LTERARGRMGLFLAIRVLPECALSAKAASP
jgi:hypothetical protein